jgi:HEAT repeat protein
MRRALKTAATLVLVTAAPGFASVAFAHGGSYRGPAGEVPPDSREPSDPPPPPEGGGPQTPGGDNPGGPTTGGPDTGGPTTPGGGGSGPSTGGGPSSGPSSGGGGGGGPTTGGAGKPKGASKGSGYEDWTFWWNYNKDEILQLKSAVKKMQKNPTTGSSAGAFGKTAKSGTAIKSATDESIQKIIVPLLHQFLDDKEISFHIQSAAELGLAKIGDDSIIETLKKMAVNEAKPPYHREVQESAGLAFGLLQKDTEEVRSFLIDAIKDGGRDDSFLRPFSAISLGLLGDKNDRDSKTRNAMLDVISHKEAKGDIKPSCLTALGLLGNDAAVGELLNIVQTGKTSQKGSEALGENDIAYAISALGKIGRPGTDKVGQETAVLDEMFKILDTKSKVKHSTNERRSAAIALGQIGPRCEDVKIQKKTMEALKTLTEDAPDTQEKNFAIISLGRMGSAKGVDEKLRGEMIAVLNKELKDGNGLTPPFAALALGLIGRAYSEEKGVAPEEEIRAPIRKKFEEEKEAKARGAYAVASGLVRDPLAVDKLKAVLTDAGADKRVRGYCALGLGMIGAPEAVEAIKATLKNDSDRDLRVQTAMAAGLLGDGSVIEDIVKILKDKDASNYELGSAALALGQIGDESAIDALVEIAKDEKKTYPDLTRALATVALGQIGDRKDVPTLSRVATDINYRAHVAAITELLTIL